MARKQEQRRQEEETGKGEINPLLLIDISIYLHNYFIMFDANKVNMNLNDRERQRERERERERLTVSVLRCCLLYGLYLGLLGFPATLSLCLLLEICCNDNSQTIRWNSLRNSQTDTLIDTYRSIFQIHNIKIKSMFSTCFPCSVT